MDNEFLSRSGLTVDMLLCDAAQVAGGKLFVLGGGLASIGPKPGTRRTGGCSSS